MSTTLDLPTVVLPTPPGATQPTAPRGATVHVLAWRLYDYRGAELTAGGLQRWLVELARLLVAMGHPVHVHQRAERPFRRELEPGIVVEGHRGAARATSTPWFNLRVHRAIPANAPVVYMAEDLAHPICRPRSLVVQHGIWWDGEYGWLRTRLAEFLARHAVKQSAATVCVDTNFGNWFRARWPDAGCDHKLHFVPNFLDPAQWGPAPTTPAAALPGRVTVCFPRRSEPRRGIWLMAEIAPRLAQRFPSTDFRFVVGSGYHTEQLRARLQASGLGAERWRIEALPMDRMREAYAESQIAVIPTLCGEGTSLSAIEAMYFGCAVVSTWVGGLPNLIQDGDNGLLTAPIATSFEGALTQLLADRSLRVRLGTRAMASAGLYGLARWRERIGAVLGERLGLGVAAGQPAERA
ncbi:MAG: glycosyltransferase family 4 protein [Planctomycetes bacterium]|nr:glycosyltransferase family 4 protein [Planctomycetota bacterium]